jgi:hypothetical protein
VSSGKVMSHTFNEAFFLELGRNPGLVAQCDEAAARIADIARQTAPVDKGTYRDSIHTEHASRPGRHVTEVVSDDPKALVIESKRGTLARATIKARSK